MKPIAAPGTLFARPLVVDLWDSNTVIDERGNVRLRQVILWRFRLHDGQWDYFAVCWKLADQCHNPERINNRWVGVFGGRRVEALMFFETTTYFDFEVEDRKRLPESERR